MTRREFSAFFAGAGFLEWSTDARAATVFPVRYARPNPYDAALQYLEPGSDGFAGEKAAMDLEARVQRIFAGTEAPPEGLRAWVARRKDIQQARFFALPDGRMRFEIALPGEYHTGLWKLPDFTPLTKSAVTSPRTYFRDVTSHVFGREPSFQRQLLPGNPYWRARLDSAVGIDVYGNQGIAVGDIDNDGVDEMYVCQPGGLPNRLYKMRPDGTAEDITERAGVGILDDTTCALFADFRNSGRAGSGRAARTRSAAVSQPGRRDVSRTSRTRFVSDANRKARSPAWRRRITTAMAGWTCISAATSTFRAKISISFRRLITTRATARRISCSATPPRRTD